MRKYFLLALSNIKKSKSQMITIIALVLIAAMFLNIWLVLSLDYSQNYKNRSAELNSEQALITFSAADDAFKEICEDTLKNDENVVDYEIVGTISSNATIKYSSGTVNCYFSLISHTDAKNKELGKYKFLTEVETIEKNTVYVPYLLYTGGGYNIGDKFEVELEQKKYSFVVGGFFENMLSGSMNGSVLSVVINDSVMEKMQGELTANSLSISVKIKDGVDDKKFTSNLVEKVSRQRLVPYFALWTTINEQARTFISGIIGSIIAMVAFLITLIVLIVITFNISNKVEEEMKSLGVLKGVGYKSKQIILSILFQFLAVTLIAYLIGIALSYAVLPLVASLLITQTGVVWQYEFSVIAAGITLLLIGVVVSLVSLLSAGKIKKITPMTALREGIETHSFKKNVLPLEKTALNIHASLGLKSLAKNKKQSIAIAIIMAVLTFVGVFAGALYNNIALNPDTFIKIVAGENADVAVSTVQEYSDEVFDVLSKNTSLEKVYSYNSNTVYVNDTDIMCYISDDFSQLNNQMICYDGRLPKHGNEVAIGGLFAKSNSLKIGDKIKLRFNKPEVEFLITGFTQSANYMGNDCMLTADGFEKIGDVLYQAYYVNVKENANIKDVISGIEKELAGKFTSIVNIKEAEEGSSQVYVNMLTIVAIAAIVIILLVIFLVLYLMVKTFVLKKRKELGILKALGFSTNQLVFQTMFSFLIAVVIGVAVGVVLGIFLTNPLFTVLLSSVGIMKSMFEISVAVLLVVSLSIVLFSCLVTFLVSRRIKHISAYNLLVKNA